MKKKAASKSTKRAKSAKSAKSAKPVKASPPSNTTATETPGETAETSAAAAVVIAAPASSAKPSRKRAAKKTSIRYSPAAKAEILQFVRDHDKTHKRGGQAAAVKKFGVTALSISKWQKASKSAGKPPAAIATTAVLATATAPTKRKKAGRPAKKAKSGGSAAGSIKATLSRMLEIRNQIDALNAEFEDLKTRI